MQKCDWGWQGNASSLRERGEYLLKHLPLPADIVFEFTGDGVTETISAHRFFLAIGSEVFYAMFYGPLGNSSLSKVAIPNYPKHVFQALIDFMYSDKQRGFGTDEEKNNGSDFMLLLQCTMQYGVLTLASMCRVEVFKFLGSPSTMRLLEEARILGEHGIEQEALDRIDCNPLHILKEADLSGVSRELMEELLQRSELNVKDDEEIELYNIAKKWALCATSSGTESEPPVGNKPALVSVIEPLLKCIRFPLLTTQQIHDGPVEDGVYTEQMAEQMREQTSATAQRRSKKVEEVGELEFTLEAAAG